MSPALETVYRFVAIPAIRATLHVLAPFRAKIRERLRSEAELWHTASSLLAIDQRRRVWFHAASMGELEQLLPIIERLRAIRPDVCIVSTSSSPSGRNHAARQSCIDHALYLPLDQKGLMREFVARIGPAAVVIDRYDIWPMMIGELHRRGIPVLLINATMPSSARMPMLRSFTRQLYGMVDHITAVTADDAKALSQLVQHPVSWLPDTRLDRVIERVGRAAQSPPRLPLWSGKTLVVGSSWPDDERLVIAAWTASERPDWRLVIVPHEPSETALKAVEKLLPCQRLSRVTASNKPTPHIVVDSVGHLLELYATATAAYVGGGFGAGVHSLAEPAGFGLPIACGPRIERSRDASGLLEHKALSVVTTSDDVQQWLSQINNAEFCKQAHTATACYVHERSGSAEMHLDQLLRALPPVID